MTDQPEYGSREYLLARVHGELERDRKAAEGQTRHVEEGTTARRRQRRDERAKRAESGACPGCGASGDEKCRTQAGHEVRWRHNGRPQRSGRLERELVR